MANTAHLKILKQGVEVWNRWRERCPDIRPDLEGVNLESENLEGINLRNARLKRTKLQSANLRSADLLAAYMWGADLRRSNLTNANLEASNLETANLWNVILRNANLRIANIQRANLGFSDLASANLQRANLWGADLREAVLDGAKLQGTHFQNVNLSGANLSRATFAGTTIGNIDLSLVRGLGSVEHTGPSSVGIDTLKLTAANLSGEPFRQREIELFLRGLGLNDFDLDFFHSQVGQPIEFYSCFISYSHADKSFARRLHDGLQARGIRCWLDEHQLLPGDDIYDMVDLGIRLSDKVLLGCSEASLTSWWVNDEIEKALEKERQLLKDRGEKALAIIPLNLDGYLFDWQDGRAATLRKRLAADFTGWEKDNTKFEEQFERVVKALRANEGTGETPLESRL